MKIEQIEAVLSELQDEDQTELKNLQTRIKELKTEIPEGIKKLSVIEKEGKRLEFIDEIKRNDWKNFHSYFPIIEIPTALLILIDIATSGSLGLVHIGSSIIATILISDSIYVSETIYKRIDSSKNPLKRAFNVLKELGKPRRKIKSELMNSIIKENNLRDEIEELESEQNYSTERARELEHELAYIDGSIQGVKAVKAKNFTDEIKDNTKVVEFVKEIEEQKAKRLTK